VGLLKKLLRPKHKVITKAAHHNPAFRWELGRTVEKYSNQTQKESQRAAHHSIPAFRWELVGLLKNTLKTKHKGITKSSITQSLLYRWELGRTVEKYS
jgi:hypothetical protein